MNLIEIGKFIAQLRKERMLSQEQLGKIIGVTNKTISRWETGTYLPPAEMLLSMSKLFDVSINANQGLTFPNAMENIANATRPKICRSRP